MIAPPVDVASRSLHPRDGGSFSVCRVKDVAVSHVFSAEGFQTRREGDRLAEDGPEILLESHRRRRIHTDSSGKPYRGATRVFL